MNAPALDGLSARWQDRRPLVLATFPDASSEEAELRARLLLIRDGAQLAMANSCDEALYLLHATSAFAHQYALSALTIAQLKEMRRLLMLATTTAGAMQVLMNEIHAGHAGPSSPEGDSGRG